MSGIRKQSSDSTARQELHLLREMADAALQAGRATVHSADDTASDMPGAFAKAARNAAVELLQRQEWPVLLHLPGQAPLRTSHGAPRTRIILTPLSAPADFARGMPFAAFCHLCAVALPPAGPLGSATARAALTVPLAGARTLFTSDGAHAWAEWQGRRHGMSATPTTLENAAISVALGNHAPGRALAEVIGAAREVRCMGGASAALLAIAGGQLQAHIDLRGNLTAHDWLAAITILRAAGGEAMLLDEALEQAPPPTKPEQRHGLIAAASRELLEELLAMLRRAWL